MPPARRRGGKAATTRSTQPVLSFGAKSRVTKPSAGPSTPSEKAKALEPLAATIADTESPRESLESNSTSPSQPHVAELAVRQQAKAEIQQPLSEDDKKATRISKKQLQEYWKKEELKSRGPRVHHDDLSLEEKILRHFDLSSQYGVCFARNFNLQLGLGPLADTI
ncbi:hypothetical protein BJX63DRAFT_428559 [Aspergillus granulosus]|uniref:DNA polymerase delta subunit 4 n=1 Tax=Aspergillus granulosus TaxID=176169 RepID=A0ABR4HWJ6_9EURO